jgi:hypothetical protein
MVEVKRVQGGRENTDSQAQVRLISRNASLICVASNDDGIEQE